MFLFAAVHKHTCPCLHVSKSHCLCHFCSFCFELSSPICNSHFQFLLRFWFILHPTAPVLVLLLSSQGRLHNTSPVLTSAEVNLCYGVPTAKPRGMREQAVLKQPDILPRTSLRPGPPSGSKGTARRWPRNRLMLVSLLTLDLCLPSPAGPLAFQGKFMVTASTTLHLIVPLAFFHHESLTIPIYHHTIIILYVKIIKKIALSFRF